MVFVLTNSSSLLPKNPFISSLRAAMKLSFALVVATITGSVLAAPTAYQSLESVTGDNYGPQDKVNTIK